MLDVAIEKMMKDPSINPVIRSWEVKRKGKHDYSIVYKVYDCLLKNKVVIAIEPDVDKNEVQFTRNGLQALKQELDFWSRMDDNCSALEKLRLQTLAERVREFERFEAKM
jgi:hypothetical protein